MASNNSTLEYTVQRPITKIDTHSHIYPDFYRDAVIAAGGVPGPDGMPSHPVWSVEGHLKFMEDNNITKSILSCSSPGTSLIPNDFAAAVTLSQQMNDFLAQLKQQYPDKFGFFASLPLPAIKDSLAEIDRVVAKLNPDGFVFMSNAFGIYGGDPKLTPIYKKLNDINAIVFVHPACPCPKHAPAHVSGVSRLDYVAPLMSTNPAPILEFIFDTTRNISDLIMTGTVEANAHVRWIIPHAGAALPSVLDRFVTLTHMLGFKPGSDRTPVSYTYDDAVTILRRQFFFDLAGSPMNNQIYSMRRIFGAEKYLYGSDFPFTPHPMAIGLAEKISQGLPDLFDANEVEMIFHGNAENLFGI